MHDISDPGGASRGDRKQARRLVDDAYAAGRVSALDRSLRMEQIDAASTRGDLAMIVRDLEGGAQDRPSSSSSGGGGRAASPVPPPPEPPTRPGDVPQWPTPGTPESASSSWPPPTFTPAGGADGAGPGPTGANKTVIGCIVAVVVFLFLGPCVIGIIALVFGMATSSSTSSSSGGPGVDGVEMAPVGGTYADGYTWDDLYWGLEGTVGTTEVMSLSADPSSATAVVEEAGVQTTWTWQDGSWVRTQSGGSSGGPAPVDVSGISDATLQSAIDRVRDEQALTGSGSTMFDIDAFAGMPRITVTVSADNGSGTGTFPLDELG